MPGIRPLLKLSFAANHASGLGLAGFHAVNVALHAANARPRARAAAPARGALRAAGHAARPRPARRDAPVRPPPRQTEAVTYVSGRSASLAATFVLASAVLHLAGRDGGPRPRLARALSPLLLACGLATKELAIALPAALVAIEAADLRRPRSRAGRAPRHRGPLARRRRGARALRRGAHLPAARGGEPRAARPVDERAHAPPRARLARGAGRPPRPARRRSGPARRRAARRDARRSRPPRSSPRSAAGVALLRRRPAAGLALLWTVALAPGDRLLAAAAGARERPAALPRRCSGPPGSRRGRSRPRRGGDSPARPLARAAARRGVDRRGGRARAPGARHLVAERGLRRRGPVLGGGRSRARPRTRAP